MEYQKEYKKLMQRIDRYPNLRSIMKNNRAMICGGACTSVFSEKRINDFDLYFHSTAECANFVEELLLIKYKDSKSPAFKQVCASDNALTFKCQFRPRMVIQVIRAKEMIVEDPHAVFYLFDYTINMCAYDFAIDSFVYHERFFEDLKKKVLNFNPRTLFPICSLYRSMKYQKRGYRLTGLSMIKLALAINALEMSTYRDLKRQLMGIDTLLLKELTDKWEKGELRDKEYNAFEAIQYIEDYLSEKLGDGVDDDGNLEGEDEKE